MLVRFFVAGFLLEGRLLEALSGRDFGGRLFVGWTLVGNSLGGDLGGGYFSVDESEEVSSQGTSARFLESSPELLEPLSLLS